MNKTIKSIILSISLLLSYMCFAVNYSIKEWNEIISRCALMPENILAEMSKLNIVEKQAFTTDVTKAIMTLPLLKWRIENMPKAQAAFNEALKSNIDELPQMKVILQTPDRQLDNVMLIGDLHSNTNNLMSETVILIRQSDIGTLRVPRSDKIPEKRRNQNNIEPQPYRGQIL